MRKLWEKCKENKEEIKINAIFSLKMAILLPIMMQIAYVLMVTMGMLIIKLLQVAPVQR